MTPGPGHRKFTPYLWLGPGGKPLALASNEGLGGLVKSEEMMNCKQGDLAIVVRSLCGNEGSVVRCVRFVGDVLKNGGAVVDMACWEVDPPLPRASQGFSAARSVPDANLRPLRDSEEEDEILRLAGRPVDAPEAA